MLQLKGKTFLRKLVRSVSTVFQDGPEARRSSGTAAGRWPMLQRGLSPTLASFNALRQLSSSSQQRPSALQRVNLALGHGDDFEPPGSPLFPTSAARLASPRLRLRSNSLFEDDDGAGNSPLGRGSGVRVAPASPFSPPTRGDEADPESVPEPVERSRGSASSLLHRVGAGSRNLRASVSWAGTGAMEHDRAASAAVTMVGPPSPALHI